MSSALTSLHQGGLSVELEELKCEEATEIRNIVASTPLNYLLSYVKIKLKFARRRRKMMDNLYLRS